MWLLRLIVSTILEHSYEDASPASLRVAERPAGDSGGPPLFRALQTHRWWWRLVDGGEGGGAGAQAAADDEVGGRGDEGQPPGEDDDGEDAGGDVAEEVDAGFPGFVDLGA